MATRNWYMMAGNWNDSTKWMEGAVPTAADDVVFQGAAACTITANAVCRSLDANTYLGTLTHNSSVTLSIGDGTAGAGNVALKLGSGMTYTLGNASTSAISFISSSATQQTITTAGKTLGNVTFNHASGSWILGDNLTTSGAWTFSNGAWSSGGYNITLTTGVTFGGGGKTYNGTVSMTGSGAYNVSGVNTFTNLTRTGTSSFVDSIVFNSSQTISGVLTLTGNSKTNRLLVSSLTLGTAITLTCNGTVTVNGADFKDITGTGSASWNISGVSNYSGDCGGNSGITFTAPATQTWSGTTGGAWSTNAWSGRVPLPQDDVVVNAAFSASQSVSANMPRLGKNISFTGVSGAPTFNRGSLTTSIFGSLTLAAGVTMGGGHQMTLEGRGAFTLTRAGATISCTGSLTQNGFGSTYTFQDSWVQSGNITLTLGSMSLNSVNVTCTLFSSSNTNTRSLTFGSSVLSLTSSGTVWLATSSTGLTVVNGSGVINLAYTGASAQTFAGGGKSYPELRVATGGAGVLTITGANTFEKMSTTGGVAKSIVLPGSTTTTLSSTTPFPSGAASNLLTFTASSGSATVSCANPVDCDYVSLTNIVAAGSTPFYAGTHSTNGGGNTNWTFTDRPAGGQSTSNMLMLMME